MLHQVHNQRRSIEPALGQALHSCTWWCLDIPKLIGSPGGFIGSPSRQSSSQQHQCGAWAIRYRGLKVWPGENKLTGFDGFPSLFWWCSCNLGWFFDISSQQNQHWVVQNISHSLFDRSSLIITAAKQHTLKSRTSLVENMTKKKMCHGMLWVFPAILGFCCGLGFRGFDWQGPDKHQLLPTGLTDTSTFVAARTPHGHQLEGVMWWL